MAYLLPGGAIVDEEGLFEALEGTEEDERFFLDTRSGDIGAVPSGDDAKLLSLAGSSRYVPVPSIPFPEQLRWLESFLEEKDADESGLAEMLRAELRARKAPLETILSCESLMEAEASGSWIAEWDDVALDHLSEAAHEWLLSLPCGIVDVIEGDECGLPELLHSAPGRTIGDILEAKANRRRGERGQGRRPQA